MTFDTRKYYDDMLEELGLDPKELTEEQRRIIIKPVYAPEDYHQDGEITPEEAFEYWRYDLHNCGLKPDQIAKAYKVVTG